MTTQKPFTTILIIENVLKKKKNAKRNDKNYICMSKWRGCAPTCVVFSLVPNLRGLWGLGVLGLKTSQELRILSSVKIDCQITKIVMDSGFHLSELLSVSQMSQVPVLSLSLSLLLLSIIVTIVINVKLFIILNNYKNCQNSFKLSKTVRLVRSCFLITLIKCLKGHKSLGLPL